MWDVRAGSGGAVASVAGAAADGDGGDERGGAVLKFAAHSGEVVGLDWAAERYELLSCSQDHYVKVWDMSVAAVAVEAGDGERGGGGAAGAGGSVATDALDRPGHVGDEAVRPADEDEDLRVPLVANEGHQGGRTETREDARRRPWLWGAWRRP